MVTIALLAALGHDEELAMHVRATRNTGATEEDLREAMMHVAIYAGVPAANHAIKIIKQTYAEMAKQAGQAEEIQMSEPAEFSAARPRLASRRGSARPTGRRPIARRAGRCSSLPQSIGELSSPVFGDTPLDPLDNDLIRNYATTAMRSASASSCMAACWTRRAARAGRADRDLAGQCRRQIPPWQRQIHGGARSQFRRRRARHQRRRGPLLLPHHPAGPLSVAQ